MIIQPSGLVTVVNRCLTTIGSIMCTSPTIMTGSSMSTMITSIASSTLSSRRTSVSPVHYQPLGLLEATSCVLANPITTAAVTAIRGGMVEAMLSENGFDLKRAQIRLEGIHSYGVISALLMNAALRIFSSTPKNLDKNKLNNAAKILFTVAVCASVVAGAYTSIAFTLLSLYSKTALGMGKDQAFLLFFTETASLRKNAFDSFLVSLISFNTSFILAMFLSYSGPVRWCISGSLAFFSLLSITSWSNIIYLASKLIYS